MQLTNSLQICSDLECGHILTKQGKSAIPPLDWSHIKCCWVGGLSLYCLLEEVVPANLYDNTPNQPTSLSTWCCKMDKLYLTSSIDNIGFECCLHSPFAVLSERKQNWLLSQYWQHVSFIAFVWISRYWHHLFPTQRGHLKFLDWNHHNPSMVIATHWPPRHKRKPSSCKYGSSFGKPNS